MSFVVITPEILSTATADLAEIGSALAEANSAVAAPTTKLLAAGADEISAAIADLFGGHAEAYQAVCARAAAYHAEFVRILNAGAISYAGAEAANASPLQMLEQQVRGLVNAPTGSATMPPLPAARVVAAVRGVPV